MFSKIDSINIHVDSLKYQHNLIPEFRSKVLADEYNNLLPFAFEYSNYYLQDDGLGLDCTAQQCTEDFMTLLDTGVNNHKFKKFEGSGDSWEVALDDAYSKLKKALISDPDFECAFTKDYELLIPSKKSGTWRCILYISSHSLDYCKVEKEVCEETLERIKFYRNHKNDNFTDTFYHIHLDLMGKLVLERMKTLDNTLALLNVIDTEQSNFSLI